MSMSWVVLERPCNICKLIGRFDVKESDYREWLRGALIQNCFSYLDKRDREQLISGFCPDCYENLFNASEEELDENEEFEITLTPDGALDEVSELKVLHSNAGYYIGREYKEPEQLYWMPYSRDSGYYATRELAEAVLGLAKHTL